MNLLRNTLLWISCGCVLSASAIPANPRPVAFQQADGSTLTVTLHGDEHFSYYTTADGYALQPYDADMLGYVTIDNTGTPSTLRVAAREVSERDAATKALLAGIDREAVATALAARGEAARRSRANVTIGSIMNSYPTVGSPRALVLLVEYSDYAFQTADANAQFSKLMKQEGYSHNGATGSCLDYFIDNSMGLFTPQFDVYGPVTLPNTMAYYGAASGNAKDARAWEMLSHGCQKLKEMHPEVDFRNYDNDGDGVVDNVFIFYAGYGQNNGASTNTVWPHAACLSWYETCKIDGVLLDSYACTNELNGNSGQERTGIGTFCHEYSHVLGLPDLYSTDGSTCFTPGVWELMDVGPYNNNGNTPPYMSAFDRFSLKWLQPRELNAPETVVLNPIYENEAYLITTAVDSEFYLLENRQQTGWDTYVPGHGMLVWHVDYDAEIWKNNKVNVLSTHQRVDIVEADGMATATTRAGDTFPGMSNVTSFTDDSSPAMSAWTGIRIGKPITEIKEISGVVSFHILGGGDGVPVVHALEAEQVGPTSFTAVWEGNVTASAYEVDLYEGDVPVPTATYTCTPKSLEDCRLEISGLQPSTEYGYAVRALDGDMKSANSNRIRVTTTPPTFDMTAVEHLTAEEVGATSFTARWDELADADGYEISVYTKTFNQPVYDTVDFTGGISGMPAGWSTIAASTSSVAGTYGAERPSLALKTDGDDLVSPLYEFDINSLSFWYASAKDTEATLTLEAWNGSKWVPFDAIAISGKAEGETVTYSDQNAAALKNGATRVRFTLHRTAGTVYLDDVKVAYNGAATYNYVADHEARPCTTNSCHVTGLAPSTLYYYIVRGTKGDDRSMASAEESVTTNEGSGVSHACTGTVSMRAADGTIFISNGSAENVTIELTDARGMTTARFTVDAGKTIAKRLPKGISIAKVAGTDKILKHFNLK